MTISTNKDRSDVFCPDVLKPLFEKVLDELNVNSVFTRIFAEMMPQGIDVTKFGRISKSRMTYGLSNATGTKDGVYRYSRILDTEDKISIRLGMLREYDWNSRRGSGSNGYDFTDKFSLYLDLTDLLLKGQYLIKSDLHTLSFRTRYYTFDDTRDFEAFVIGQLADDFNNNASDIQNAFETLKERVRNIHKATARY